MPMQEQFEAQPSQWRTLLKYAVYFVGWVVFAALGVLALLSMRNNLIALIAVLEVNRWARVAVHNFSFVILGLIWMGLIIIVEHYFRTAVAKNLLAMRIATVLGAEIVLLAASSAFQRFLISLLER